MLADVVGAQVAALRKRKGMTREELAKFVTGLGWRMTTDILINIETRRTKGNAGPREVTVDEIVVLARALEVPPVLLLFPVGTSEDTETGLGDMAPTWQALRWFVGESQSDGSPIEGEPGAVPLVLYRRHQQLLDTYSLLLPAGLYSPDPTPAKAALPLLVAQFLAVRADMRRHGLLLPVVPIELAAQLDQPQASPFHVPPDSPTAEMMRSLGVWDAYATNEGEGAKPDE